jgi:hypothetical protein
MKNFIKQNWLSIIAIIMLVLAVPSGIWPYSYYQILRVVITVIAGLVAYSAYKLERERWVILMAIVAILFNPIIPFYFSKGTWSVIDLITAVVFLVSIFKIKDPKII